MERERGEREGKEVSTWYSTYVYITTHVCTILHTACMCYVLYITYTNIP